VRFAVASSLPALAILSVAATARNIYFAPALPGVALLLAWWAVRLATLEDPWDRRALRATALLLLLAVPVLSAALTLLGMESWQAMNNHVSFVIVSLMGLGAAAVLSVRAWRMARAQGQAALWMLAMAYCAILVGPLSQVYRRVDDWQDLPSVAVAIRNDALGHPLILFAPDETTRAVIDLYARTTVMLIPGTVAPAELAQLRSAMAAAPQSLVAVQLPGRSLPRNPWLARYLTARSANDPQLPWLSSAHLRVAHQYALPNGRRYALLERDAT